MSEAKELTRQADGLSGSAQIRIAPVTELADFERCVEVQLAVWGYSDGDLIPKRVFIVAERIGGQVIAAFDGENLVGFAMSLPGYRDGKSYLHSHMLAVLPEYRNGGLGRKLKLAQRDDALARGFDLMEWTFDPLEIKNAHLNIVRLGAIVRRYIPDFYGHSTSPLQGGLPTDRLVAEWWLRSKRVRRTLGESGEQSAETTPDSAQILVQVQVPAAVRDWKRNADQRNLAESLQSRNRLALESAFERGLAITGYERGPSGDGCFLLGPVSGLETE
ncbi:MAG TPA: GNAT family N-acetyltransferase [Acidobacteriaceae bacterium]|jgi:predicted GNAT superfamily acetyltransferase